MIRKRKDAAVDGRQVMEAKSKPPHFEFYDEFKSHADYEYPDGWLLERHSAMSHGHAYVLNGAFALLLPGNKHIALTPPLSEFSLELQCRGDVHYNRATGIIIYFRYDTKSRTGYYVHIQWGADGTMATFGSYANSRYQPFQTRRVEKPIKDTSQPLSLCLDVGLDRFKVVCGGIEMEPFHDSNRTFTAPGQIAFDNSAAVGATEKDISALGRNLFLEFVRITSPKYFAICDIWAPIRVEFPAAVNGMQKPFVFEIAARKIGDCHAVLSVRLTGGSTHESPSVPGGFYFCNEELIKPYIRLETNAGIPMGLYYLVNGRVGLHHSEENKNFLFMPVDAECPVEVNIRLEELPANARLFVGYEFYQHEAARHQRGGPTEAWIDPGTGRILYVGAPLRPGCRILEIASPENKAVCRQLPKDDPRYNQALAFARANHFFMETENCVFRTHLRLRDASIRSGEWTAHAFMENAFRERIQVELQYERKKADDTLSVDLKRCLEVETLVAEIQVLDSPGVGVYHLVVQWSEGNRVVVERRCAFEIMPTDPCALTAPLASGLPELYSYPREIRDLSTNVFDPWQEHAVDECHYMSGVYFQPDFGRSQRVWSVLHAYRRQWLLILNNAGNPDPSLYSDLARKADYVIPLNLRYDLWKRQSYKGEVLEEFRRFIQEMVNNPRHQQELAATESSDGMLTPQAFRKLADQYWKQWIYYFSRHMEVRFQETCRQAQVLNPQTRCGAPDHYPTYASVYKGGYFPLYMGYDVIHSPLRVKGPVFLEDYPYAARYNIQRGVYQLTSMKLVAPEEILFVEMYAGCACPADGALLFGHPPYSFFDPPPLYFRKRSFEFAYAAVWFGKNGFEYWKDYGFHARTWDREQFSEFLKTWGIIRRTPPAKPLRTTAFGFSPVACRNHADYHEPASPGMPLDDMFNTAEECTAYAYEQARTDGQPAGFLLDMESIRNLDPADVDTLVLPPLADMSTEMIESIREKHKQGINLLGFETVTGLEDLFGVTTLAESLPVHTIRVNPDYADDKAWRKLAGLQETCNHPLCRTQHALKGARSLLDGMDAQGQAVGPVLTIHQTKCGWTALFCVPPTVVNRADQKEYVQYGQECLSRLMNLSTALVLRFLGRPLVETTAGKLIAFSDPHGQIHVIVMEDAWPDAPKGIAPRLTLHLRGVGLRQISCDQPFSILDIKPDRVSLRVRLEPHDSAMITIGPG